MDENIEGQAEESLSEHLAQQELEVLQAIYPDAIEVHQWDDDDPSLSYTLRSPVGDSVPTCLYLNVRIPVGYPEHAAAKVRVLGDAMGRTKRERLTAELTAQAERNQGAEVVLELMQELQQMQLTMLMDEEQQLKDEQEFDCRSALDSTVDNAHRIWIWVHHITNPQRQSAIVAEATTTHHLHGCLKVGYPGIVLVEGPSGACDAFVTWIKGNKSRPDGFGRQWGHHVRRQIVLDDFESECKLTDFCVFETMKQIGAYAQEHGLQDEFRSYALQHHT